MYIPLELAKKHLNIESSYTEDDEYILATKTYSSQRYCVRCGGAGGSGTCQ